MSHFRRLSTKISQHEGKKHDYDKSAKRYYYYFPIKYEEHSKIYIFLNANMQF